MHCMYVLLMGETWFLLSWRLSMCTEFSWRLQGQENLNGSLLAPSQMRERALPHLHAVQRPAVLPGEPSHGKHDKHMSAGKRRVIQARRLPAWSHFLRISFKDVKLAIIPAKGESKTQ